MTIPATIKILFNQTTVNYSSIEQYKGFLYLKLSLELIEYQGIKQQVGK
jgi:hypothetical protein